MSLAKEKLEGETWTYKEAVENVASGRYQVVLLGLLIFASYTTAVNNNSIVFIAGSMNYICKLPNLTAIRKDNDSIVHYRAKKCSLTSTVQHADGTNATFEDKCSAWKYESPNFKSTIMSEWDFNNCEGQEKWKIAFASSMYMVGFLIGCIVLGNLSDRYGRRMLLVLSAFGLVLSGVGAAYAVNFVMFVVMRFLLGSFTAGVRNASYAAVVEISPEKWRTTCSVLPGLTYSCSALLNTLISFLARDWRDYQLISALTFIWFILYWWFIPESPRWQLVMGKNHEAMNYFKLSAKINRKSLPENLTICLADSNAKNEPLISLVRTSNLRRTSFMVWILWCIVAICAFSMKFNIGNIGEGVYLNMWIFELVSLPMDLLQLVMIKLGRRLGILCCFLLIAIFSVSVATSNPGPGKIVAAAAGTLFSGAAFSFLYVITSELYPTSARVTALGVASSMARVGGAVAPYVVLTHDIWPGLPYIILTGVGLIGAILAFFLPETMNRVLPDTLQEAERRCNLNTNCHFVKPCSGESEEEPDLK